MQNLIFRRRYKMFEMMREQIAFRGNKKNVIISLFLFWIGVLAQLILQSKKILQQILWRFFIVQMLHLLVGLKTDTPQACLSVDIQFCLPPFWNLKVNLISRQTNSPELCLLYDILIKKKFIGRSVEALPLDLKKKTIELTQKWERRKQQLRIWSLMITCRRFRSIMWFSP